MHLCQISPADVFLHFKPRKPEAQDDLSFLRSSQVTTSCLWKRSQEVMQPQVTSAVTPPTSSLHLDNSLSAPYICVLASVFLCVIVTFY